MNIRKFSIAAFLCAFALVGTSPLQCEPISIWEYEETLKESMQTLKTVAVEMSLLAVAGLAAMHNRSYCPVDPSVEDCISLGEALTNGGMLPGLATTFWAAYFLTKDKLRESLAQWRVVRDVHES